MIAGMRVHEWAGMVRQAAVVFTAAAALTGAAAEATAHSAEAAPGATITARVGAEVGVVLGPDGAVSDVSTVPARIIRERRGGVLVVTIV
jgi:hypothetical protein